MKSWPSLFLVGLLLSVLTKLAESVCTDQYWNPLNNACVDCTDPVMQNARGITRTCTLLTLPRTSEIYNATAFYSQVLFIASCFEYRFS